MQSPFQDYLDELLAEIVRIEDGAVADYIPELAKARPADCAIAIATVDGHVYAAGDADTVFSIQSVSKPFTYAMALERLGPATLLQRVGVEPTGEAFNSIVLDEKHNRPFNPMVNAGAIAVAALARGATPDMRLQGMIADFSAFAGHDLTVDEAVYLSEHRTGHRNRAITWLMLNSGMIEGDPEEVLALYFQQCAIGVTAADLAVMGAVLANNGVHPVTGRRILSTDTVRDVLSVMLSCGMYDYAGEWSYEVGLPAKSGVSGAVMAVLPGQLSIAIWSPPLDEIGNSVRGIAACRRISRDFGLHPFLNAATVEDVIRRDVRGNAQSSLRIRNPHERDLLAAEGNRIAVVELQGGLHLASAERMIRHVEGILDKIDFLVLSFRRVTGIDPAAQRFFADILRRARGAGVELLLAELDNLPDAPKQALTEVAGPTGARVCSTADAALETAEQRLLDRLRQPYDSSRFALDEMALFNGLAPEQLKRIEDHIRPLQFEAGERVLTAGDTGRMFFVLARGSVSVEVPGEAGAGLRLGGIGPGQFFGEMAILGGEARSADIVADERVVCYGLTADSLEEIGREDPAALSRLMTNMALELSARLRRANGLISALR